MGFRKTERPPIVVTVEVGHDQFHEKYEFLMPRATMGDKRRQEQIVAIYNGKHPLNDWLAGILLAEPVGFEDFPQDERQLPVRVKEYFNYQDDKLPKEVSAGLHAILFSLFEQYYTVTTPAVGFRLATDSSEPVRVLSGGSDEASEAGSDASSV